MSTVSADLALKAATLLGASAVLWFGTKFIEFIFRNSVSVWERDGVIRGPMRKVWKDDNPREFGFITGWSRGTSIILGVGFKALSILLVALGVAFGLAAAISLVI